MKAPGGDLSARYLKLSRRERALAVIAALVLVAGFGGLLFIDPVLRQRAQLLHQITAQRLESESLQQRMSGVQQDPGDALRAQLVALQSQLRTTDSEFETLQNGLVQPQHMGALLRSLLTEHRSLQLLGLRTLPVTGYAETPAAASAKKSSSSGDRALAAAPASSANATAAADDAWLYRHAVEIRVQGTYADMTAYLQALEDLPRRVHWGDLEIDARNYPLNVMTVTIFTVSLEKSWWIL